jgi:hypothetical protein
LQQTLGQFAGGVRLTMLRDGIMAKGADVQVQDIVAIIAESVA